MNKMARSLTAMFTLAALAGLAHAAEIPGVAPAAAREAAVKASLEMVLLDSESARYKFGDVECARLANGPNFGGNEIWSGVAQKVLVNAKNRMGAYAGWSGFVALYDGGGPNVYRVLSVDEIGSGYRITLTFSPCVPRKK